MKTQNKNGHGLYLQKRNKRWKWMAGATAAAAAAGMAESRGSMVTINLVNNYISAQGGNHLNADLTGDGHPDLTIANSTNYFRESGTDPYGTFHNERGRAGVDLNGIVAAATFNVQTHGRYLRLGLQIESCTFCYYHSARSLTGSIPIFFRDLQINGGAPTSGLLEVTVFPDEIQLDSFVYNTQTAVQGSRLAAVPDQGSSLALLAMGVGGILEVPAMESRTRSSTATMKTQNKNGHGLSLQKRNNRWKWMAGATAATAAGVTASQASTITINLVGNFISATDGNHLNADLTGDGHPDLTIANAFNYVRYTTPSGTVRGYTHWKASVNLNGVVARANVFHYDGLGTLQLGSHSKYFYAQHSASLMGSIPIFFKDLHINGGAPTRGSLEVTVFTDTRFEGDAEIQLDSLTYNTPGHGSRLGLAVPDQGSSLALLAMGASGVLALRRWRAGRAHQSQL